MLELRPLWSFFFTWLPGGLLQPRKQLRTKSKGPRLGPATLSGQQLIDFPRADALCRNEDQLRLYIFSKVEGVTVKCLVDTLSTITVLSPVVIGKISEKSDQCLVKFGCVNWVNKWIGHRKEIRKLTFRASALRRSESGNCGLCVIYIGRDRAPLLVGVWQREKQQNKLVEWKAFVDTVRIKSANLK